MQTMHGKNWIEVKPIFKRVFVAEKKRLYCLLTLAQDIIQNINDF